MKSVPYLEEIRRFWKLVEKNLKVNERPNVLRSVKAIMEAERIERRKSVSRVIKKQDCSKPFDTNYRKS